MYACVTKIKKAENYLFAQHKMHAIFEARAHNPMQKSE